MTDAEAPAAIRKPTAKEIAEDALEQIGELRAEIGTVRTELKDLRQDGVPMPAESTPPNLVKKVADLETDIEGLVDNLNLVAQRLTTAEAGNGGASFDPTELRARIEGVVQLVTDLDTKTGASFAEWAKVFNAYGESMRDIKTEIAGLPNLRAELTDMVEKVRVFDEAGVAPASAEDLNDVHQRVNELRVDLGRTREMMANMTGPLLAAGRTEASAQLDTPRAPTSGRHVYAGVERLMATVTQIGKDKQADKQMGGYAFRSIDAAMDAVGNALREPGVALAISPGAITNKRVERYTENNSYGKPVHWTHVWVDVRYTVTSLVDGSEIFFEMSGEARDPGDKATSKAVSMAYKYMLTQGLCIPITGLPESDGGDSPEQFERPSEPERSYSSNPKHDQQWRDAADTLDRRPEDHPAAVADGERAPSEQPADTRSPAEQVTAAYQALSAIAGLEKSAQRARFNAIVNQVNKLGIGGVDIQDAGGQTMKLSRYIATVNSLIGTGA